MAAGRTRLPPVRPGGAAPAADPAKAFAIDAAYRRLFAELIRRARWKHGLSKEDAGDVVQDAFVVAWIKIDGVRDPRAWLFRVVDHLAVNLRRRATRRARLLAQWAPGSPEDDTREEI